MFVPFFIYPSVQSLQNKFSVLEQYTSVKANIEKNLSLLGSLKKQVTKYADNIDMLYTALPRSDNVDNYLLDLVVIGATNSMVVEGVTFTKNDKGAVRMIITVSGPVDKLPVFITALESYKRLTVVEEAQYNIQKQTGSVSATIFKADAVL